MVGEVQRVSLASVLVSHPFERYLNTNPLIQPVRLFQVIIFIVEGTGSRSLCRLGEWRNQFTAILCVE